MSTPVVPNEGEIDMLTTIKANTTIKAMLFQNDATVDADLEFADLTDADFSGYTSGGQTVSYGSVSTNGSGQAEMTATAQNHDHNGGGTSNTIYGYAIYNASTNKILKAEKFDSSVSMQNNGDRIALTDKMLLAGTIT